MSLFSAVLLGLVQGVAEFLPVSSSGHLAIAEHLLNMQGVSEIPEFYDVLLHLGTLLAVFVSYWDEIYEMIRELFSGASDLLRGRRVQPLPPARRMIVLVVVATLPLFVLVPVRDFFEQFNGNIYFVGGALIFTGCMLFLSDRAHRGTKNEATAGYRDALIVGLGQAVALFPGVSRSGMTITAGCFVGYERKFAVRFSFIMSIPAILGANVLSLKDAIEAGINTAELPAYFAGVAVAAAAGYACIRLLKAIAARGKFGAFAYYCWAVGLLVLVFTAL